MGDDKRKIKTLSRCLWWGIR